MAANHSGVDRLPPYDEAKSAYNVVIETVRGSRNKMKWEPQVGALRLHRVLPLGTSFPFDFGFIPGTLGADGDPLDVLVFMDESAPPGSVAWCRLVGVIEAIQSNVKKDGRNDRLLAVGEGSFQYAHYRSIRDVPEQVLDEVERFFGFYHEQNDVKFRAIGRRGARHAEALVQDGIRRRARS